MSGKFSGVVVACLFAFATAAGASEGNQATLSQGGAAGVQQAQTWTAGNHLLWVVGGAAVVGGIVLVATGNGHGAIEPVCTLPGCTSTTTTTTTTPTTTTTTPTTTTTTTTR